MLDFCPTPFAAFDILGFQIDQTTTVGFGLVAGVSAIVWWRYRTRKDKYRSMDQEH